MNTQHGLLEHLSQSHQLTSLILSLPLEPFSRAHFHVVLQGLLWHILLAFTMRIQTQLAVIDPANSVWSDQHASDSNCGKMQGSAASHGFTSHAEAAALQQSEHLQHAVGVCLPEPPPRPHAAQGAAA